MISPIRTGAISQDISLTLIRCSRAILSGLPSLLVLAPPNSSSPSLNMYYLGWRPRTLSNVMLVSVRFFLLYFPNRSEVFPSLSGDFAGIYVNSNGSLTDLGITYASTVEPPYGWNSSCSSNSWVSSGHLFHPTKYKRYFKSWHSLRNGMFHPNNHRERRKTYYITSTYKQ